MFTSKYGVARHIYIPIPKAGSANHAVGADWTPSAGDVKISKDGGAAANVTNLPSAIAMGNSAIWDFSLTNTEMQAAQVVVIVADSATKAVDDTGFEIETYGNASAQHAVDFADSVRAGLTALPNAAAEAAGGLYTRGTGAGQIAQQANGQADVNLSTIKTQSVTCAAGVTVLASVGTAATNTAQTGDTYALANGANGFVALKADTAATLVDTNELQTDWTNGGRLDLLVDVTLAAAAAIKLQTDKFVFTVANQVDANVQYINDVELVGDGAGTPMDAA